MSSLNALSNISFFLSLFSLATSSESLTHFMTFLFIYYSTLSHHFEFLVHAEEWGLQSYQAYRGHHNHNTPYCCPELHEAALCRFQPPSQTGDKTDRVSVTSGLTFCLFDSQKVRVGCYKFSALSLSTGSSQGCVLSPYSSSSILTTAPPPIPATTSLNFQMTPL